MSESATDSRVAAAHPGSLTSPPTARPDRDGRSYAIFTGPYGTAFAGSLIALRTRGHHLPELPTAADLLLVGIATHKLSRLIAKDKVTSFMRAPFTRFQELSGQGVRASLTTSRLWV
jgi:hypothetical protein